MEYRELGQTGLKLSNLSFGASSLGSVFLLPLHPGIKLGYLVNGC